MTDAITIKNMHKLGISEVVGGMYTTIGIVKYWANISLSPVEDVLRERSKTTV